jgi:hypothetical protein
MKKIVRLTESDIVRLVKKVINENTRMAINEGAVNAAGGTFEFNGNEPYVKVNGRKFKTTIDSLVYKGPVNISRVQEKAGSLYGKNVCVADSKNQEMCFDISKAQDLVNQVNQGKQWIEMGNSAGKVIFQAWQ